MNLVLESEAIGCASVESAARTLFNCRAKLPFLIKFSTCSSENAVRTCQIKTKSEICIREYRKYDITAKDKYF
jgi:hypothetical protein